MIPKRRQKHLEVRKVKIKNWFDGEYNMVSGELILIFKMYSLRPFIKGHIRSILEDYMNLAN
jgi:hypothetical protein